MPNDQSLIAHIYNAEIFKRHGLTEEEDQRTCDVSSEILQVRKDRNERPRISRLRGASGHTEHIFVPFVQATVGRKGVEDVISEDGRATDAPEVAATHRMVDLATEVLLEPDLQEVDCIGALGRPNECKDMIWNAGVWGTGTRDKILAKAGKRIWQFGHYGGQLWRALPQSLAKTHRGENISLG